MWPTSAAPWHLESASPSPCRLRLYPHSNYGPVSPGRGPYGERCSGSSLCVCLPVCLPSVVCLFPLLALPVSFTHLCYHKRPAPGGAGPAYIPVCPPLCLCPATCPILLVRYSALFHRPCTGRCRASFYSCLPPSGVPRALHAYHLRDIPCLAPTALHREVQG